MTASMGKAHGDDSGRWSDESRPTATLLLDDEGAAGDAEALLDPPPATTNVLVVSATRSMQEVVAAWRRRAGTLPAAFGLVTYAEFDRSASASAPGGTPSRRPLPGGDITLTSMSDPTDLRRLGTAVTLYLEDWTDTGRETLIYVDALSPFLDATDSESAFQFLHLLVQSADQLDASVLVGLDPSATDERTVNTIRPLFDDVVDATVAPGPHVTELHDLLGNRRRRFVLRALLETPELGLERLTVRLACRENDTDQPTDAERDRAYTALASIHVPRLADAGLVTFDREAKRVRLADGDWSTDRLRRYLTPSDD